MDSRLVAVEGQGQYTLDSNGNLTARGNEIYTYDTHNRLIEATVNGVTATYAYNYRGQRISKTVGGQTTLYFYGPRGHLIAEIDAATGQTIRAYVWLEDQPLAYITGGQVYFIHNDHLGTPLALTDSNCNVVWRARYMPFGHIRKTGSVV